MDRIECRLARKRWASVSESSSRRNYLHRVAGGNCEPEAIFPIRTTAHSAAQENAEQTITSTGAAAGSTCHASRSTLVG
ncbi:hypothetical protein KCP75_01760 [Salmonella enterica subsp. enterica]|nr:hypothetical protein KCP75_01760 [Salmonella enterica subsp. enterica]